MNMTISLFPTGRVAYVRTRRLAEEALTGYQRKGVSCTENLSGIKNLY